MRPSGPVPVSAESSIPRSRAIRRASAGLHAPAVLPRLADLGDLLGGLSAALALLLSRGTRRPLLLRLLVDLLRRRAVVAPLRRLLTFFTDEGDRLADGHLALGDRDLQQDARSLGLDLLRHLVRVELVERLALLDPVALRLEPLDDRAGLHALAQPREFDLVSHAPPSA
jgi:hypothetical protein